MLLKKYYPIIILAILSILSAQHQHKGDGKQLPKGCEIYGMVVDSITGSSIEYVSISIIDKNKNIETGGITNLDGKFDIK